MNRRCLCDRDDCRLCWLFHNDQRYRTMWGGDKLKKVIGRKPYKAKITHVIPGDCIHLGMVRDRKDADGKSCGCEHKWLKACDVHGLCRVNQAWEGANCQDCAFYWSRSEPSDPPEFGWRRNLVYFVCPIRENGMWQWNLEQLKLRMPLFNGRKIVAVATGSVSPRRCMKRKQLDAPELVEEFLAGTGCETIRVSGHSKLDDKGRAVGEVVAWNQLWSSVLPGGYGEVTFYAHAKGVSRPGHHVVKRWAEVAYESNLDYWPLALEQLKQYPVVGSFKKTGHCFDNVPKSSWHYGGTFFWARNRDFARRDWGGIVYGYAGTEAQPGVMFGKDEAGVMFHEAFGTVMNCYSQAYWEEILEPEYEQWKSIHERHHLRLLDDPVSDRSAGP